MLQMLVHIFVGKDLVRTLNFDLMKSGTNMIQAQNLRMEHSNSDPPDY